MERTIQVPERNAKQEEEWDKKGKRTQRTNLIGRKRKNGKTRKTEKERRQLGTI